MLAKALSCIHEKGLDHLVKCDAKKGGGFIAVEFHRVEADFHSLTLFLGASEEVGHWFGILNMKIRASTL